MTYLHSLILRISCVFAIAIGCFCLAQTVSAATITVCASGCDVTKLGDIFPGSYASGDEISVGATYDPSLDTATFPLLTPQPFTMDCHNSGATLTQTNPTGDSLFYLPENSTLQNCNIGNLHIAPAGPHPDNVRILNNNFSTTATSTIRFYYGAHDFLIEGNTNINGFSIGSVAANTSGIIRNNTFYFHNIGNNDLFSIEAGAEVDHLVVASNTFESHVTTDVSPFLIFITGDSTSFVTNTVRFLATPHSSLRYALIMQGTGANVFSGNIIDAPGNPGSTDCYAAQIGLQSAAPVSYTVLHNTLHIPAGCSRAVGLGLTDNNNGGTLSADIRYN